MPRSVKTLRSSAGSAVDRKLWRGAAGIVAVTNRRRVHLGWDGAGRDGRAHLEQVFAEDVVGPRCRR
jgi:hypothetical protein